MKVFNVPLLWHRWFVLGFDIDWTTWHWSWCIVAHVLVKIRDIYCVTSLAFFWFTISQGTIVGCFNDGYVRVATAVGFAMTCDIVCRCQYWRRYITLNFEMGNLWGTLASRDDEVERSIIYENGGIEHSYTMAPLLCARLWYSWSYMALKMVHYCISLGEIPRYYCVI